MQLGHQQHIDRPPLPSIEFEASIHAAAEHQASNLDMPVQAAESSVSIQPFTDFEGSPSFDTSGQLLDSSSMAPAELQASSLDTSGQPLTPPPTAPAEYQASNPELPPRDDIFARLYPSGRLWTSKKMISDHPDVVQPQRSQASDNERESTASPEPENVENQPSIPLRFSKPPLNGSGYVFGTDPALCDFVLPKSSCLSRCHFTIEFQELSLFIRDLGSKYGTSVRYNPDQEDVLPRREFQWIASDPVAYAHGIVITPSQDMAFYLDVVPEVFNNPPRLAHNLQLFRRGAFVEDKLNHLGLESVPPTIDHTGALIPTSRPCMVPTQLSLGKSLIVACNVSTGERAVLRKFSGEMRLKRRWISTIKALERTWHVSADIKQARLSNNLRPI